MRRTAHKYGKGQCDRCGWIFKLNQLKYEWTGYKVCSYCWDPLPAQDFPRPIEAEDTALVDPRPRNNTPADNGLARGAYQIIGRSWRGTDLTIETGEVIRS